MPIPTPTKGEDQQTYIGRCQSILSKEFPDQKQRSAVCFSQWRKHKGKKDSTDDIKDRNFVFNIDNNEKKSKFLIDKDTGFLNCEAYVTRTGVFDYYDEDGNLLRELRPEDEVFSHESLDSLKLKPIVEDHPDKKITIDNIKDFQIGTIGENLTREDTYVKGKMVITDKDMIETIIARKEMGLNTELSCGYSCKVIPEIGEHRHDGYYTFKQKNIRYNHVGIVDVGRAGSNVRILDKDQRGKPPFENEHTCRLTNPDQYISWARENEKVKSGDKSIDFVYGIKEKEGKRKSELQSMRYGKEIWQAEAARNNCQSHGGSFTAAKKTKKGDKMLNTIKINKKSVNLDSFKMDALSGLISEEDMGIFDTLSEKLDEAIEVIKNKELYILDFENKKNESIKIVKNLTDKRDELQGKIDQLSETVEKQKKDISELSDINSERIINMIKIKADIAEVANKLKVNIDKKDLNSIKIDCIKAVSKDFDAKDKSDIYINARFDAIQEGLDNAQKKDGSEAVGQFIIRAKDASGGKDKLSPREEFLKKDKESRKKE